MEKTQLWKDTNANGIPPATCRHCGARINPADAFCTTCGQPVEPSPKPDESSSVVCGHCGAPINPGDAFCTCCGNPVNPQPSVSPVEEPIAQAPEKLCLGCGEPLVPGNKFCIICGRPVNQADEPPIPPSADKDLVNTAVLPVYGPPPATDETEPQATDSNDKERVGYCIKCGSPLYAGDAFCTQCATPVEQDQSQDMSAGGYALGKEANDHVHNHSTVNMQPTVLAEPSSSQDNDDDDDPTVRSRLLVITVDEARNGCTKTLRLSDGTEVQVDVPAGANPGTKVDIPDMGLEDKQTGRRGPLRVSFFIMR